VINSKLPVNDATPLPPQGSAHATAAKTPYTVALPPPASAAARWRSWAKKRLLARAVPQRVLVTCGRGKARRVALTFDDGPDEMTPRYLDLCDTLNLRATFFLVGESVERAPHMALEYVRRGHEVAGHGYTHEPFPSFGPAKLVDELARTDDLLAPGLARRPLVRPPGGRLTPGTLLRIAAAGYTTVLWSLDSDDCRTRDPGVVAERLAPANVAPGEIVLLHEMQPWTLEALPAVVNGLRDAGFDFVTVSELLGY
jgi:peptidoglycan/xylan/chitin deacetylase (PgdA/CDA1 family)